MTVALPSASAVRVGRVSFRVVWRPIGVGIGLSVAIVGIGLWSLTLGDFPIPASDVFAHLRGDPQPGTEYIVGTLRLPRTITAVLVGATFGMSGAIFQSLARNPLGSPDVIGLDAGAAAGAVFVIVFVNGSATAIATGALLGGALTGIAIFVAVGRGRFDPVRLVLIGVGVGASARAAVEWMLNQGATFEVQQALVWLTGSLNGRDWGHVRSVGLALVTLMPIALLTHRRLLLLELGDDAAMGLGVAVRLTRRVLVPLAVALTALGVAAAGPIAFIALMAPTIARRLAGTIAASPVLSALVGSLVLLTADLLARRAFAPTELPAGLATALIGAPYLLWLLQRRPAARS